MSTKGSYNYRPNVHFTPPSMWMNDPNGMVYAEGVYHFFYQHYPNDTKWGPMHWGHSISRDLLKWEHLPVAIWPDELGYIFSGSCVYDNRNTSGFGSGQKPPLVAIFTSHGETNGLEQQSIAYSKDGVHFEKYYGNPVIPNTGEKDFRDPKVFYNPVDQCWSMVVAAGEKLLFYKSGDLKSWNESGRFVPSGKCAIGICECPDCFPVKTEDGIKWVLIVSMITNVEDERKQLHRTMYYIGEFDGNVFESEDSWDEPVWLDDGWDNYAAVSFQNLEIPTIMGWASNWKYADLVPTGEYCGQGTIPREISIVKTPNGNRIRQNPVGLEAKKAASFLVNKESMLRTNSFGIKIQGTGTGKIILINEHGQKLLIEVGETEIIVDRTHADDKSFSPFYGMKEFCIAKAKRQDFNNIHLEILFDISLLEVFGDNGLSAITMSVYPSAPYYRMELQGDLEGKMYLL